MTWTREEATVYISGEPYALADDIPDRPAISLRQEPKAPVGPGSLTTIVIPSLAGGCNQRIAGAADRYSYSINADTTQGHAIQRAVEITTYDLSATYAAFADSAGHKGGFFIDDFGGRGYGTTGAGALFLITPRHVICVNLRKTGTASAATTTTLTHTGAFSEGTNYWAGAVVIMGGRTAKVVSNTVNVLTVTGWGGGVWGSVPTAGAYIMYHLSQYAPTSVASLGTHTDGDGKEVGGNVGYNGSGGGAGAFTGCALVGNRYVILGREADEIGVIQARHNDGWVGAHAIVFDRTAGTFVQATNLTRLSYGLVCMTGVWGLANHYSATTLQPVVYALAGVTDSTISSSHLRYLPTGRYFTGASPVGRALCFFDDRGQVNQFGLSPVALAQAPVLGGLDHQFGMGPMPYARGVLAPHRGGLFFLTEPSGGQWREAGLYALNPGDAMRTAYPLSYANPDPPYVAQGAGEIYMMYGCHLYVIQRNPYGPQEQYMIGRYHGSIDSGGRFGGRLPVENILTSTPPTTGPTWHPIAQVWNDSSTEKAIAMGVEPQAGPITVVWVASTARKLYRIQMRAPEGTHYPTSVAGGTATIYGSRYGGPAPFAHLTKQFLRIRGWFDGPNAGDKLSFLASLDGAGNVQVGSELTTANTGPFSVDFAYTSASQGKYIQPVWRLTTGTTSGYPKLLLPLYIDCFAIPGMSDEFTLTLRPWKPLIQGTSRVWQVVEAENVRGTLAALVGSVVTIRFPMDSTGWPCVILDVQETGMANERHLLVTARRLS